MDNLVNLLDSIKNFLIFISMVWFLYIVWKILLFDKVNFTIEMH